MKATSADDIGDLKEVAIRCTAAVKLDLHDLTPLQGNLKNLSPRNFEALKKSIIQYGITFPFFIWRDGAANYILDGTQRDRVLLQMSTEGYTVPALPCALIEAKDRKEAAEKILLISSQYGKLSDESLHAFLNDNDIDFSGMEEVLELPDIDLDEFNKNHLAEPSFTPGSENDQSRLDQKTPVQCPECGHQFVPE